MPPKVMLYYHYHKYPKSKYINLKIAIKNVEDGDARRTLNVLKSAI